MHVGSRCRVVLDLVQSRVTAAIAASHLPMLRHVAEPLHARRLQPDVRVEAAGDGAVDDGLLLLVQQRDQLLLGADVAPDPPVRVVEEADDGCLLVERRDGIELEVEWSECDGRSDDAFETTFDMRPASIVARDRVRTQDRPTDQVAVSARR